MTPIKIAKASREKGRIYIAVETADGGHFGYEFADEADLARFLSEGDPVRDALRTLLAGVVAEGKLEAVGFEAMTDKTFEVESKAVEK